MRSTGKTNHKIIALLSVLLFTCSFFTKGYSQTNTLEKIISLSATGETVDHALSKISQKADVYFSYNSAILPQDSIVSFSLTNVSVEKSLYTILGKNYYFKTLGNNIIILKKSSANVEKLKKAIIEITGYVYNSKDHLPIADVSIFDVTRKYAALTDPNGNYKLTLTSDVPEITLGFSKNNYTDTVVFIKTAKTSTINIYLQPLLKNNDSIRKIQSLKANVIPQFNINDYKIVQTFVKPDMLAHAKNLELHETRTGQFSILPYIGTNRRVSGAITNRVSLNAVAGYSGGVNGVELGTLLNISKNDVSGFQFAGFGNITGGNTHGLQMSGIFNRNAGNVGGLQMSGFSNYVKDTLKGMQFACINYVKVNKGFQLGIINTADTSEGVSIGFATIVRNGYYNLSLFADEMFMANIEFKMGTQKFYNIWGLSAASDMWGLTYGIGFHNHPERKFSLNYDLSFTNMSYKKPFEIQVCMKTKFSADMNFRLNKRLDLFTRLSFNVFASDKIADTALQDYVSKITVPPIWTTTFLSVQLQSWPGASLGIKWRI